MSLIKNTVTGSNYLQKTKTDADLPFTNPIIYESDIILNTSLSNLQASGIKASLNVNTNSIGFAACLTIDSTADQLIEADASPFKACRFMALETGTGIKMVLLKGIVRNDSWTFTRGDLLYLSDTSGTFSNTAGTIIQCIGYVIYPTMIYFDPDRYYYGQA